MKLSFALIALLTLTLPPFANAAPKAACAFGESSADLSDMLDKDGRDKIWYKGEHLSVHNKQRLQGLSDQEKLMILISKGGALKGDQPKDFQEEEALADFASSDGYITYFSHNSNGREFVQVASYPGDNEFGVILEIKKVGRKKEYSILSVVAVISDGDLEDCKVLK